MSSNSANNEYVEVVSTVLPDVSVVRIYATGVAHIGKNHPEVLDSAGMEGIVDTIRNPTQILEGKPRQEKGTYVYVSDNVTYKEHPLNVMVKVVQEGSARLRTALFTSDNNARVLWRLGGDAT